MAIEQVESGGKYIVHATACPVCDDELDKWETLGRHIVQNEECRRKIAGEESHD